MLLDGVAGGVPLVLLVDDGLGDLIPFGCVLADLLAAAVPYGRVRGHMVESLFGGTRGYGVAFDDVADRDGRQAWVEQVLFQSEHASR